MLLFITYFHSSLLNTFHNVPFNVIYYHCVNIIPGKGGKTSLSKVRMTPGMEVQRKQSTGHLCCMVSAWQIYRVVVKNGIYVLYRL
jgi:hypothetical protein